MFVSEFTCGCIVHPLAGTIRKCGVQGARSLSGKFIKLDCDLMKHNRGRVEKQYRVASILP